MSSLIQPSFSKGEVNPELFGRIDTAAYKIGLATARNVVIKPQGGAINRAGLEFVGMQISMSAPSRLRRFRFNTTDTYMLEFGNLKMRVIRDKAHVLEAAKTIVTVSAANPPVMQVTGHGWAVGDDIQITTVGMPYLNGRRVRVGAVVDANNVTLNDIITGASIDATAFAAFTSGTAARVYTLATPFVQADLATLKFVQSADVVTITHPNYPEQKLGRTGDTAWTLTQPSFIPGTIPPVGVTVTPVNTGSTSASYVVTATDATSGTESLPTSPFTITNSADPATTATKNTIAWGAVANASSYSVYKAVNGVYGFIGYTPDLTFLDNNFLPSLATTPPASRNPFSAGNNPSCSTYYQQRHVRAGSNSAPATLWYSQTANFYNFNVSTPSVATDAITSTLTSREVNAVRHMVPVKDLLVFTAGGEWRINSTGTGFASSTMEQLSQSTWGCSHIEPIVIGLTVLFVPEAKVSVRSFSYTYVSDAYTGNDLTLVSGHLFQQYPLIDWGFSRIPDPVIYGVRADGQATAFTWQEEQQVSAWARWDTLGNFETVDVVRPNPNVPDEIPYFGVQRVINGHVVRYIERMHSRRFTDVHDCFFVDAGASYDSPVAITGISNTAPVTVTSPAHPFVNGQTVDIFDITWYSVFDDVDTETQPEQLNGSRFVIGNVTANTFDLLNSDGRAFVNYRSGGTARVPKSTVSGLYHLEGATVQALADGNVVSNLVVTNGTVTLPYPASRIHVGLKYVSDIQTLDLEVPQGTIQGKYKRAANVTIRFCNSRGIFVGQNTDELIEMKQRQDEDMGDPTDLITGDKIIILGSDWNENGRMFLRQRYPLPMEILAIIPELDIEG